MGRRLWRSISGQARRRRSLRTVVVVYNITVVSQALLRIPAGTIRSAWAGRVERPASAELTSRRVMQP